MTSERKPRAGIEGMDALKEEILSDAKRLTLDDSFSFRCHQQLACFNKCCADVNIVLTPYDILRLKHRLGMTSTELIAKHTVRPFTKDQTLPVVLLKLRDELPDKPCAFVTAEGCGVYQDRPWPCRMYPVGVASARTEAEPNAPEFYFLMQEEPCDGFAEGRSWTIRQWKEDQGVQPYDAMGDLFKEITLHPHFRRGGSLNPQQMEMFFMATYDLDRFRAFVFESSFLEKYEVEPETVEKMRADDEELLRFGFRWLRACLFSEPTVRLKATVRAEYEARIAARRTGKAEPER
jgi:Fe-S-cluster containining protein